MSISADDQTAVFNSEARDITAVRGNGYRQLYQWSASTNASQILSAAAGGPANEASSDVEISSDGRVAVFASPATDRVSSPTAPGGVSNEAYAVGLLPATGLPTPTPAPSAGGSDAAASSADGGRSSAAASGTGARLANTGLSVEATGGVAGAAAVVLLVGGGAVVLRLRLRRRSSRG